MARNNPLSFIDVGSSVLFARTMKRVFRAVWVLAAKRLCRLANVHQTRQRRIQRLRAGSGAVVRVSFRSDPSHSRQPFRKERGFCQVHAEEKNMKILVIGLIVLGAAVSIPCAQNQSNTRPTITNEEDFRRAMKELSNWGRWGADDELGAANLITPAKRKQALALAKEGVPISLAHDIVQEKAADAPNILERVLGDVSPTGTTDTYRYSGTYHGVIHSHLDAVDCHVMADGKGYNGRPMEDIKATGGCPKGNINVLKDGVVTRAVLFDATRLPGKATEQGWLEPGTAIHREDLEALEKLEHVTVSQGDVILLYTGR